MIDSANLRTASLYINNQLLSRGLLRDGETIDFVSPGRSADDVADSMGRIMSVVNDLILRRDRDAEHREALSTTLRTLRAENLRQANDLQRLHDRNADAQRKVALAETSENAVRTQLKTAEGHAHKLKEEAARAKTLVAQSRAACANEVRKRDRQIEALKKAVTEAGRARGTGKSPGITTITVTGENRGDDGKGTPSGGTASEEYDLRMETNGFLAELARGLSEENETLRSVFGKTCDKLKEMSGWHGGASTTMTANSENVSMSPPAPCDELISETNGLLDHLKNILTNPSFVPIEEVMVREEEINRLRGGWEKMESRWKEAVLLIDGWRKRMATNGRPVNIEELKMGLRLSPVRVKDVAETSQGLGLALAAVDEAPEEDSMMAEQVAAESPCPAESLHLVPAPIFEDPDDSDSESEIYEDEVDIEELEAEEPNVQVLQHSMFISSPPLPPVPQLSPLRDHTAAGNRGVTRTGNVAIKGPIFAANAEENAWDVRAAAIPLPQKQPSSFPSDEKNTEQVSQRQGPPELSSSTDSLESVLLLKSPEKKATSSTSSKASGSTNATANAGLRRQATYAPVTKAVVQRPRPPPRSGMHDKPGHGASGSSSATEPTPARMNRTEPPTLTKAKPATVAPAAPLPASAAPKTDAERMPPPPARSPQRRNNSRLPRLGANGTGLLPPAQQSPLTMASIAAKLAASEREADAARVRAKLKAARAGRRADGAPVTSAVTVGRTSDGATSQNSQGQSYGISAENVATATSGQEPMKRKREHAADFEAADELQGDADAGLSEVVKPRKRERRTSKVASRRRSTLNPWELESLIQGSIAAAPPVPTATAV
jgi:hypothetical protein